MANKKRTKEHKIYEKQLIGVSILLLILSPVILIFAITRKLEELIYKLIHGDDFNK